MTPNTQKQVDHFLDSLNDVMNDLGGYHPQITLFGINPATGQDAVFLIIVPPDAMVAEVAKNHLLNHVMPQLAKKVVQTMDVLALAYSSEIWIRSMTTQTEPDWSKIDKSTLPISGEALFVSVQHDGPEMFHVYDIIRKGKAVTATGELVDKVTIIRNDKMSRKVTPGPFSVLFQIFKDAAKNKQ